MNLTKAGQILLAVILATGWGWTKVLEDNQLINTEQRLWLAGALTALVIVQQIYLLLPTPAPRDMLEARRTITEAYLTGFLSSYYQALKPRGKNKRKKYPLVRVNIMLPHKRFKGLLGTRLRIGYHVCPQGIVYTDAELTLEWAKGDGTCGWAWQSKNPSVFDSEEQDLRMPTNRLKKQQRRVVKRIKSTLSVPIWYDHEIVGILNLDSTANIDQTKFIEKKVLALASGCSIHVAAQCFKDGVIA